MRRFHTGALRYGRFVLLSLVLFVAAVHYANADTCQSLSGTCHYVDPNAGGANTGASWANAWTSLSSLTSANVHAGDTVYISGGSVSQSYTVPWATGPPGGSAGLPVTYAVGQDAGHAGTVIFAPGGASSFLSLSGNNCIPYLTFNGSYNGQRHMNVTGYVNGYGIYSDSACTNSSLIYMNFINTALDPGTESYVTIAHDYILDSVQTGGQRQAAIEGGTYSPWSIHDNYILLPRGTSSVGGNDGIAGVAGGSIYNNTISWFYDSSYPGTQHPDGIQTEYAQHLKIYNNVILNPGNSCMVIDPFGDTVTYIYIYNNQCYFNNYTVVDGWADEGIGIGSNGVPSLTFSNILMCNNLVIGGVDGVTLGNSGLTTTFTNATLCNNIWTANSGGVISPSASSTYTQANNIQVSTSSNPGFVSYPQLSSGNSPIFPNFNLTSSAVQFIQKGMNEHAVFTTDAAGRARPASGNWDIGPYQYGGPVTTTTSVPTTSTTSVPTTSTTSVPTTSTISVSTTSVLTTTTTVPQSSVLYKVQVTFTNSQSSPTPSPFQAQVSINPQSYSAYEAADLGNIRFGQGATTFFSWCESGCTSGSSSAVFWVRLPNGIAANGNVAVNMSFMSTGAQYEYDSNAGEAPQLTAPMGKYDNGGNVFRTYWNSTQLSTTKLPSSWIGSEGYNQVAYYGTAISVPVIIESLATFPTSSAQGLDIPFFWNAGNNFITISNQGGATSFFCHVPGSGTVIAAYSTASKIFGLYIPSLASQTCLINYLNPVTLATNMPAGSYFEGVNAGGNFTNIQWYRSRAYPPNGVMPTVSVAGATTTSTTATTSTSVASTSSTSTSTSTTTATTSIIPLSSPTSPTVSATSLDGGQTVTFSTYVTNGIGPYTYNFIISAAGGAVVAFGGGQSSNSFTYTVGTAGTLRANVVVKDSETSPATKNSVYSSAFTVASAPTATALTPSNSIITLGQGVTFNVLISGGTGPFTLKLTASNGVAVSTLTGVAAGIRTFGTVFPQFNPSIYNVIALDTGTTNQFIFTSTSSSVTVDNAPTSTTSTSTSTTTTSTIVPQNSTTTVSSNPGGPSGNPGGPTGTGGSLKPTATLSGSCYTITNMTALKGTNVTLNGIFIGLVTNFIGPSSAGVTVNNVSYTLSQGALQTLFNQSGSSYTIELKTVTYLPIIHTIQVKVCSTSPSSANSTSRVLIINNSGSVSTLPITSNQVTTNIGFWPGKVAVSVSNAISNTVYLRLNNATAAASVPPAPNHYTKDFAINVTASSNTTVFLTLGYSCAINRTRVAPFLLNGAGWRIITPFATNPSLCTVSFEVPNDPVVALMVQNQTRSTSATTTTGQLSGGNANGSLTVYEVAAAAIGVAVFLVLLVVYKRRRRGQAPDIRPPPSDQEDNPPPPEMPR